MWGGSRETEHVLKHEPITLVQEGGDGTVYHTLLVGCVGRRGVEAGHTRARPCAVKY